VEEADRANATKKSAPMPLPTSIFGMASATMSPSFPQEPLTTDQQMEDNQANQAQQQSSGSKQNINHDNNLSNIGPASLQVP